MLLVKWVGSQIISIKLIGWQWKEFWIIKTYLKLLSCIITNIQQYWKKILMQIKSSVKWSKIHEWICISFSGGAVYWKSSKLKSIARSTMKSKFFTLDKAGEIIIINYDKSKDNVSDPLIKGLTREGVDILSNGMRLWMRTNHSGGNST